MTVAGVAIAGALGALARYGIGLAFGPREPNSFPTATFLINLSGCFVLGILVETLATRAGTQGVLRTSLTVGFLGAYTTFSTFSLETIRLFEFGAPFLAIVYVTASVVLGALFAALGVIVGRGVAV